MFDPVAQHYLDMYLMSQMGTGPQGAVFNWFYGTMAETPQYDIEALSIINEVFIEYQAERNALRETRSAMQ